MCLAVFKPAGATIPGDYAAAAGLHNPDGFGAMLADGDAVRIFKTLDMSDAPELLREIGSRPAALHWRFATHGRADLHNCHPFPVLDRDRDGADLWLIHNGVLSIDTSRDPSASDTRHYIAQKLRPAFLRHGLADWTDALAARVEADIAGSKFVTMAGDGSVRIIGEQSGHWLGGVWYSNLHSLDAVDYYDEPDEPDEFELYHPAAPWLTPRDLAAMSPEEIFRLVYGDPHAVADFLIATHVRAR